MSSRSHSVQKGVVSPVFDASGDIVVASPQTSDIERVVTGGEGKDETEVLANLGGQPQAIAYDQDDLLYIADHAYAAVLVLRGDGTEQHVVKEYEGVALKVSVQSERGSSFLRVRWHRCRVQVAWFSMGQEIYTLRTQVL